ncbi:MAG: low affinity iron permease family protein [Rhodoblastus sp.]
MTTCEPAPTSPETRARQETLARSENSPESKGHSFGFARFSATVAALAGRPGAFALAVAIVLVWAVSGPIFRWSDTWQLVINTGTTIVTFLMVFVIQNAQNRDAMAIQVKLDELICATRDASDKLVGIEDLDDAVVQKLKADIETRTNPPRGVAKVG